LLNLPYNPEEEQEVMSFLWQKWQDKAVVLLLLKRKHFRRALAVKQYLQDKSSYNRQLPINEARLVEASTALGDVGPSQVRTSGHSSISKWWDSGSTDQ